MTLYHYWRSSSSWRVRWALALKGIAVDYVPIDLLSGANESSTHTARHPMGYVPVLQINDKYLVQSVAILEWLEETYPNPKLFPGSAFDRAAIRALCETINADTQPIQNLSVVDQISTTDDKKRLAWMAHFTQRGLQAYEELCKPCAGLFSYGDSLTAADLFLIPQCYNALRQKVDLSLFPIIQRIYLRCLQEPSCQATAPDQFEPKATT